MEDNHQAIRMIITDLDGTLLDMRRELSAENHAALLACGQRGIRVVLASGRSFESVRRLATQHGLDGPIASVNGARVDLSPEGPLLYERPFTHDLALRVFQILKRSEIYFTCYARGTLYKNNTFAAQDRKGGATRLEAQMAMQTHRAETVIADESRTLAEGLLSPYKFVAFSEDMPKLHALRHALESSELPLNVSSSWSDNIEVMPRNAGKDIALRALCDHFGIRPAHVMAFGDNLNDIDMLRAAGVAVAMDNALPNVKAHAHILAPHHDLSGFAHVLRKHILCEK